MGHSGKWHRNYVGGEATATGIYNDLSHIEALIPSVECEKQKPWKSETHCAICCQEGRRAVSPMMTHVIGAHGSHLDGRCQSLYVPWLCVLAGIDYWLAADNLCILRWISKCSWACTDRHLLSHWLIKPHMPGLVTAGHTFMDVPPLQATSLQYVILASFMHCGPSPADFSPSPSAVVNHCAFASDANYRICICCEVRICGAIGWQCWPPTLYGSRLYD